MASVGFKTRRFADIQLYMELHALESADMASFKFSRLSEV